ncbi:MAG: beta-galactosidase [Verrucomicrobia bacterium]|nr:beta-galactosidase [Verrucomicrobiota bacterium]
MKNTKFVAILSAGVLAFPLVGVPAFAAPKDAGTQPVKFEFAKNPQNPNDGIFVLDGKPFQIRGGEIHPQRIPREYWDHRIKMCKAMGLNTIAFYTMWNDFEQADGSFDFKTGNRDIAAFLQLCQDNGMWVLFRPGPYVCGEWDFGGLPAYLLKEKDAKIRTIKDKNFMAAQTRYLKAIAKVAEPFRAQNGGPILMTQIENEHGSWPRKDPEYLRWLKDFWTKRGFTPIYMSDGAGDHFLRGMIYPDKDVCIGLDPGQNDGAWRVANKYNPGVPVFSSETYPGWLRRWGEGNWTPTNLSGSIKWYMETGRSFSVFPVHGGTNFGFTAGANNDPRTGGDYHTDLTSYDYGSPINEQGNPTKEYHQYREIIGNALKGKEKLPPIPKPIPSVEIRDFTPRFFANLRDNTETFPFRNGGKFKDAPYFEVFGQNQGLAFYRTRVPAGAAGTLDFDGIHDYAHIYLDGKLIATVDRRMKKQPVAVPAREKASELEIMVEGMGHINYGGKMESDRKGIVGEVRLDGKALKNWTVVPKTLSEKSVADAKKAESQDKSVPGGHFRGTFNLSKVGDTFLDMSKWGKGVLYVNGHNLGRYWSQTMDGKPVGPQLRLYCPAPFLKRGKNVVDVVELELSEPRPIRGCKERNYDMNDIKTKNMNNQW